MTCACTMHPGSCRRSRTGWQSQWVLPCLSYFMTVSYVLYSHLMSKPTHVPVLDGLCKAHQHAAPTACPQYYKHFCLLTTRVIQACGHLSLTLWITALAVALTESGTGTAGCVVAPACLQDVPLLG
jgi:hypothetical protein